MKALLACFIGLLISTVTIAQTEKGDWIVGGNLTINTTDNNNEFSLQPTVGYFFAKNFAAGSLALISFGKLGETNISSLGIGPFARYYFELKDPVFKPLVQVDFNVISQSTKTNGVRTTNTITSLFIGGGGAFFINNNVAIEGLAGYNTSKFENTSAEDGFRFRIGFQVHLLGSEVRRN